MARLESLIVSMQLETAELRKGLDEVRDKLKQTADSTKGLLNFEILKTVGEFALEAGRKLGEFVLHGAEVADQVGKMAQSAGIGVEEFSRLSYAAGLSGISAEEMGGALKHLNVNLAEAATGSHKQAALFQALGISVKDAAGNTRNAGAVMRDVAETFAGLQDGASKSALAVQLFGKAGAEMIPMLNEGSKGLTAMGQESDRLGTTINDNTAKAAQQFNDDLERLKKSVEGVALRVVADLAPSLSQLTGQITASDTAAKGFTKTADIIAGAFKVVATVVIEVGAQVLKMGTGLGAFGAIAANLLTLHFKEAIAASKEYQQDIKDINAETDAAVDALWNPKKVLDFNANLQPVKKSADDIAKSFKDGQDALDGQKKAAKELADFLKEAVKEKLELDRATAENNFKLGEKVTGITRGAIQQRQAYQDIGADPNIVIARAIAGFDDFEDALERATRAQVEQQVRLTQAENLKLQGAIEAARAAAHEADVLGATADEAKAAMEAFAEIKRRLPKDLDTVQGALNAFAGSILQAIPRLNQLVNAAQQGASVGGVWGALIAVIVQLLSQTKGFQQIIDHVNASFDKVLNALEPLVSGFASLFDATSSTTDALMLTLKAPLETIGKLFESLAPIFQAFDAILKVVVQAFSGIMGFMTTGAKPIFEILKLIGTVLKVIAPLLQIIMLPLELFGKLLDEVSKALEPAFKEIDKAISWLSNRLTEFGAFVSTLGERIVNWIKGKGFKSNQELEPVEPGAKRAESKPSEELMSDVTREAAASVTGLGDAAGKTAKTVERLNDSLTNVPTGFKLAAARFNATAVQGTDGGGTTVIMHISGGIMTTLDDITEAVSKGMQRKAFARAGI